MRRLLRRENLDDETGIDNDGVWEHERSIRERENPAGGRWPTTRRQRQDYLCWPRTDLATSIFALGRILRVAFAIVAWRDAASLTFAGTTRFLVAPVIYFYFPPLLESQFYDL